MTSVIGLTIALGLLCLAGLLLIAFQAPGIWLIVLAAVGYDWCFEWQRLGWHWLAAIVALAMLAELLEFLSSLVVARRAGASRRAAWCGLIGGIAGMFVFTLPLPLIGTIAGGVIGCFAGAVLGELTARDDVDHAVRVGLASAVGRVLGLVAKLGIAIAITGVVMVSAIW